MECYYADIQDPYLNLATAAVVGKDARVRLTVMRRVLVKDFVVDGPVTKIYVVVKDKPAMIAKAAAAKAEAVKAGREADAARAAEFAASANGANVSAATLQALGKRDTAARLAAYEADQAADQAAAKAAVPDTLLVLRLDRNVRPYCVLLCPVADYAAACARWQGKSFQFNGTKIGTVEVERGTVVHLTAVAPIPAVVNDAGEFTPTFEATFGLPTGTAVGNVPIVEPKLLPIPPKEPPADAAK